MILTLDQTTGIILTETEMAFLRGETPDPNVPQE